MTSNELNKVQLFALAAKIEETMGLHFPQSKHKDLARKLHRITNDLGCSNTVVCAEKILTKPLSKRYKDALARHLTIGETYFFRNKTGVQLLNTRIFPDIIRKRAAERTLKIWSAACATGEEPYSFAMLLDSLLPRNKSWQPKIFASDINLDFLAKARKGIYSDWSFRNTNQQLKERYFLKLTDTKYQIVDEIRQSVDFFQGNLKTDVYPSLLRGLAKLDFISCQNVFIYFEPKTTFKILKQFYETLDDGGWLLVSPSEAPLVSTSDFHYIGEVPGGIFFQKQRYVSSVTTQTKTKSKHSSTLPALILKNETVTLYSKPKVKQSQSLGNETETADEKLYNSASRHYQQGEYDKVVSKLHNAMFTDAGFRYCGDRNLQLLIHAYANIKQYDTALQCCESVIKHNKLNSLPYYLMGTILQTQGQSDAAIAAFRRAVFLDDGCELAYYSLANIFRQASKNKQAIQHLRTLLKSLDRYPDEKLLRGDDGLTVKSLRSMASTMSAILEEQFNNAEQKYRT